MKISPVAGPGQIPSNGTPEHVRTAKAVEAFNKGASSYDKQASPQPQSQIVRNQNAIAPEELGAIQAEVETEETSEELQATEQVEETPVVEKPKEDALSRQFAQLARQEKALRAKAQQQEQALRQRESELAAREAQFKQTPQIDTTKYISLEDLKRDALTQLSRAGVSYEQLTQDLISQQPVDPRMQRTMEAMERKIQELEAKNEEAQKSYKANQDAAYQAAVKQIALDVKQLVNSDPNFETIKVTGSTRDVVQLIEETYNKDGVLLTVEEAAQQVEDYLVEEGTKLAKIEKIKRKILESRPNVSDKSAQALAEKAVKQPQPMKTLTNATSSTRQLSAKERAILAFKGELKS